MPTLSQAPTSAPPMPAPEDHYYAAAARWDAELIRRVRVGRNRAFLFAVLSWLLTAAAVATTLYVLFNQRVEVVTIAYNDATQTVRHVRYSVDEARRLTSMDAVRKFHLNQWMLAAETWGQADVEERVKTLRLFAGPALEPKLSSLFGGSTQDRAMGPRLQRIPKVSAISLLKDGVAHIQFQTEELVDGKSMGFYEWAAIVEFRFTHRPEASNDLLNPFGFQVTNYRRDAATVRNP